MRAIVVIPSRLGSTRLPGKAMADIHGLPMIGHVWRRAIEADIGPVVVAGGDQPIIDAIEELGGRAVLTDPLLPTGSDRVHAALGEVDPDGDYDVIMALQGDLPTIDPASIRATPQPLQQDVDCQIATLVSKIQDKTELRTQQVVKIALAIRPGNIIGRTLYFSCTVIPWGTGPYYHHIGLYTYRRAALEKFIQLPRGVLEQREDLEQLRAVEAGL